MNNEFGRMWNEEIVAYFEYSPGICLKHLGNSQRKKLKAGWSLSETGLEIGTCLI
jgi:hypothetical protein